MDDQEVKPSTSSELFKDILDQSINHTKNDKNEPSKKKIRLDASIVNKNQTTKPAKYNEKKERFKYGNYNHYYGYRNKEKPDLRLNLFEKYKHLFEGKLVLDIGCNIGFITKFIAEKLNAKYITGLDIDKNLINRAKKFTIKRKKTFNGDNKTIYPHNIDFVYGNYVLKDEILLEIEKNQFDTIICLSTTKWIHLNYGDNGIKLAFKRMYKQLYPDGCLILEAQSFDNYSRRKNLTPEINENYKNIKFFPKDFTKYLLSPEVGFNECCVMGTPDHPASGFKRPIQIFTKSVSPQITT